MLVQIADQAREDGLQVRVVLVAVGAGGTALEEGIKGPLSRSREAGIDIDLWGEVESSTALRTSEGKSRITVMARRVP